MHRPISILLGAALLVIVIGSFAVWSLVDPTLALSGSVVREPTPTGRATDEPSPHGGLGNTRDDVESAYGVPGGLQGTMISYQNGHYAATYLNGRATALLVSFARSPTTVANARKAARALIPTDSVYVGTLSAGSGRVADVYQSARLGSRVDAPTPDVPSGQFVVIYDTDRSGAVKNVLLSVGGIPRNP